jgi:hypothetical protein
VRFAKHDHAGARYELVTYPAGTTTGGLLRTFAWGLGAYPAAERLGVLTHHAASARLPKIGLHR